MARTLLRWLGTLLIFVAALFFLVLALGAHLQLLEARQLMAEGRAADGTITGVRKGRGKSSSYYFSYAFSVGGATHARTDVSVPYGEYQTLQEGRNLQVRYDPADPGKSVTKPEMAQLESWPNRLFFPILSLMFIGWWVARLARRRPSPPAPPSAPARPGPARFVNPIRRGD